MPDARTVRISPAPAPPAAPPTAAPRQPAPVVPLIAEVTVTATKRTQASERLPSGVSVIPADQLEATGAADAAGTTGQAAGVVMTNLGPGRDKLLMRGLSDGAFTGRARSTVGTYLDDAPINYNAPDPDLRLVDVERVEIVRGPQGALYGAGSLSGVYRIVTRKPDLTSFQAGGQASYALTDGGSPSSVLEAYLSAPVVTGKAAIRATAYREVQGGYIDDVTLRRSNVDQTVREGGRLAIRLQPSSAWTVDLASTVQHLQSNDTQYTTLAPGPRRANRVAEAHENDFTEASLRIQGEMSWATLTSSTAYVRHSYQSQYDASAALDRYSEEGSDLGLYAEVTQVQLAVQDLVLSSNRGGRFGWLAGLYAARTVEDTPSFLSVRRGEPLVTIYEEARRDRLRDMAVYGEATWRVAPGWTAAAGARLFTTRLKVTSDVAAPRPFQSRSFERDARFDGVSPKLSIQRDFGSRGFVYALFSAGYRPGGVNSAGLVQPIGPLANFSRDRLENFELGAKVLALGGRLSTRGAVYYDIWDDLQSDQFFPSGLAYTTNVGDARVLGFEGELAYDFDFGLSLRANALLSHARLKTETANLRAQIDDSLPGSPKIAGGLLAVYERPFARNLLMRLVGEAAYVGRSNVTFDPASPRMGDYVRSRLSLQVAGAGWTADLFVANPLDDAGDTFAYGNPFSFGLVRQVTPQRPRTAGLALSATF